MDRAVNLFHFLLEQGDFVWVTHGRRFDRVYLKSTNHQILECFATFPSWRYAGLDRCPQVAEAVPIEELDPGFKFRGCCHPGLPSCYHQPALFASSYHFLRISWLA